MKTTVSILFMLAASVAACGGDDIGQTREALRASCLTEDEALPAEGWLCGEERTVECQDPRGAKVDTIYVRAGATCEEKTFTVSDEGPWFALGEHAITVTTSAEDAADQTCSSTLRVVDTQAPVLEPKAHELWPPNHKFRTVVPEDCITVRDACTEAPELTFLWASSDEPKNDTGDGNTEIDIQNLGCDSVELLAERKGNGDARVYRLGVRARDAEGHVTDGECTVVVPHDQGGKVPGAGPEAYRVEAPSSCP